MLCCNTCFLIDTKVKKLARDAYDFLKIKNVIMCQ